MKQFVKLSVFVGRARNFHFHACFGGESHIGDRRHSAPEKRCYPNPRYCDIKPPQQFDFLRPEDCSERFNEFARFCSEGKADSVHTLEARGSSLSILETASAE